MTPRVEHLSHAPSPADLRQLEALLTACVRGGASLGFMARMTGEEAREYWTKVAADHAARAKVVLVMREKSGGSIVGTVQLTPETRPNGRHRAEVQKLLVLPSRRGLGLGSALMAAVEQEARERKLRLLFLDTSEGPGGACGLYAKLGYVHCGGIPEYALDPDGTPVRNAIFYKLL